MRSILSALDTAQKQPSREPYIPVTIENRWEAVRRWNLSTLNSTVNTPGKHDVAVAGDGSITRVRIESATVKQQRVTAPLTPSAWDTWNNLVSSIGSQVACAARGARVAVAYTDAAGTGILIVESTDNGQTFGSLVAVHTAASAVQDLAIAYKNTSGDLAVAWVTATQLQIRRRDGGSWATTATHGTAQQGLNGIAMTYFTDYAMLVTGQPAGTSGFALWSTIYGDGFDQTLNTFGSWLVQVQTDSSATVGSFAAPSLCHDGASYRGAYFDIPAHTGAVGRVMWVYLHPDLPYTIGSLGWRAGVPHEYAVTNGLMLASDGQHVYVSGTSKVARASVAAATLDVSGDLLALALDEEQWDGHGYLDLDNTGGAYAGPPAPIELGARVAISLGYRTSSGLQASRLQDFWIDGYEYHRTGGVSVLRLSLESAWRRLRRQRNRTVIFHNPSTYRAIIGAILARAGLAVNTGASSTRYNTVSQKFVIDTNETGYTALRRALAFVADRVVLRANGSAAVIEALASQTADVDLAQYTVKAIRWGAQAPPASEVHAISQNSSTLIAAPRTDYAHAEYGLGTIEQIRDAQSTTGTAAGDTATAQLRQRALDRRSGELVLQPVVQLEPLDVVEFGDAQMNSVDQLARVYAIAWRYDRAREQFEQRVSIGPR